MLAQHQLIPLIQEHGHIIMWIMLKTTSGKYSCTILEGIMFQSLKSNLLDNYDCDVVYFLSSQAQGGDPFLIMCL